MIGAMATPDPDAAATPQMRTITLAQPLRWLALGARDLARAPAPGLSHGLTLALFGAALFVLAHRHFWLLAGAFSGFLLVSPVLATGLYAVSRELERGAAPGGMVMMGVAVRAWWPRGATARRLMRFGALLALAGTGWVLTSASLDSSARIVPSVSRVLSKKSAQPSTTTMPTRSSVWRSAERAYCAPLQP